MMPAASASLATSSYSAIFELGKEQPNISTVFDLFRRCAENPILEIGGRQIWSQYEGNLSDCHRKVHLVELTHCFRTVQSLLTVIIGPQKAYKINLAIERLTPTIASSAHFQKFESYIQDNGLLLKKVNSCFYAYVFGLYSRDLLTASSHVFLVIQYVDDQRDLQYRIFQSFLERFDLKSDFEKRSNFLNHENFEVFLRRFYQFSETKTWTAELEKFYELYFHVKSSIEVGEVNPYFEVAPLVMGQQVSFETVLQNEQDFVSLQQLPIFKDIMSQVIT